MDEIETSALIISLISSFVTCLLMNINICTILICLVTMKQEILKVPNFYENVVPNMPPRLFRRYFRMYKETLSTLTEYLHPVMITGNNHVAICIPKKIAMACAYLGSQYPTLQLSHLFGIAEESFLCVTEEVMDALLSKIDEIITWPQRNELQGYAGQYNAIGRFFPNVIGAMDDIHLEIKLTEERQRHRHYYCWKQYYSIHLQAVSTYDLRFLDIFVGWPGRSHDARVFFNNPLYRTLPDRLRHPQIQRLIDTYHIVADSAFPLSQQVITPFKQRGGNDLNDVQKKFNRNLASKRNNVERSFALLLLRFPRLNKLNQRTLVKKIKVVMAACILHNICILENDNIAFYLQQAQMVNLPQLNQQYRPLGTILSRRTGILKRLQLANIIFVN